MKVEEREPEPAEETAASEGSGALSAEATNFQKHLERQSRILTAAINVHGAVDVNDVADAGRILEEWVFKPREKPKKAPGENFVENDPKLNFYPPFLNPECIASHYPFFTTMPIPMSCKANCVGTEEFENWKNRHVLPESFPTDFDQWDDGIGSADLIADLKENQKFALLRADNGRLRWFKAKAEGMKYWCYPIISVPPSVGKLILETLMFCADGLDEEKISEAKKIAVQVASVGVTSRIVRRIMLEKWFVKNCQESLHYCFGHGFVKLVKMLTETDLSEYVTFHGLTYRNRLNNSALHTAIEDEEDRRDYLTDSIYLFLVLTWQTAMDVWQQAIDEPYIEAVRKSLLEEAVAPLKEGDYDKICGVVADIVTGGDVLVRALERSVPDFFNQSQLANFRNFVALKSGVPQSVCPILPSDCVPISYGRSPPILWPHVFMLNMASFLCNHGDYMRASPPESVVSTCLCDCNLCSPHKMPCYNGHLQDEILTLDKLSLSDGSKTATIGVQEFCNGLIRLSAETDFYHDSVKFFKDHPDDFSNTRPSFFKSTKLLSILKELKAKKEAELLKRGQGVYLNPVTGERMGHSLSGGGHGCTEGDGGAAAAAAAAGPGGGGRRQMLPAAKDGPPKQNDRQRV